MRPVLALVGLFGAAGPAMALELAFPGPTETTATRAETFGSLRLPIGPFAAGILPTRLVEGALTITAFRMPQMTGSTLEVLKGLQGQIEAAGYEVVFSCETEACGGFDFRYGTQLLSEPDMHVNLGDFRYLLAEGPAGQAVALMVSRAGATGFVQVTKVGAGAAAPVAVTSATKPATGPAPEPDLTPSPPERRDLIAGIKAGEAMVLDDLLFASGSSALVAGDYASLAMLADWLRADPGRRVVLVGHTDASGSLEGNIKLSRLRAESVRQELLDKQKISPNQVQAEGIGPLSPRGSNLTEAGRRQNRRVEVIMTSTEPLSP